MTVKNHKHPHIVSTKKNRSTNVTMSPSTWLHCVQQMQGSLSKTEFSMWIRPLLAEQNGDTLTLFAPNRFVLQWIRDNYLTTISHILKEDCGSAVSDLKLEVGRPATSTSTVRPEVPAPSASENADNDTPYNQISNRLCQATEIKHSSNVNPRQRFNKLVEGKSNQLGLAAARQVAENPGKAYNPLYIYGGTGLGKTHLLHAVGNAIVEKCPGTKVVYVPSMTFVQEMVNALKNSTIETFKNDYRSVDVLLIDDIQLIARKERSQEELFHTFNTLIGGNKQIVLASDRYPQDITGVEDRLKSRFSWGLTVAIEPPELETRVAILMKKAEEQQVQLTADVAFFIAKRLHSHVRELEGALNRVIANAKCTVQSITTDFVRETLRDILALQEKLVTIDSIQKVTADYYKIKVADLLSKKRSRSIARPRQVAMALTKELTNHSLPEIGDAFGGRDHTTVLHACRKINLLRNESYDLQKDYSNLVRTLSS